MINHLVRIASGQPFILNRTVTIAALERRRDEP
jgi:hypothetical protein